MNHGTKQNLIGRNWASCRSGETLTVCSPSDGKEFARIQASSAVDVNDAVRAARSAFENGAWSKTTATERGRMLSELSDLISDASEELAELEAGDTGKPMSQARNDIKLAARYFEYYGGAADKLHGEVIPYLNSYQVQTIREPLGVTGHIIPWNYPAQMFGRTLAPALAMGNSVVIKPAEDACMTPIRLAELALEAGFPEGAINLVTGIGTEAGAALSRHPDLDFVSFTGSPQTGTLVQQAAAANHIGCTLELGGKSPQILFDDADLGKAIPVIAAAIIQNGGQTCSAGSRALIQHSVFEKAVDLLSKQFENFVAAPHYSDRDLGPLISKRQRERVETYVENETGAPVAARGRIASDAPDGGHYFAPLLYAPVDPANRIAKEEVFGPVLCCMPFRDEAEAITLANATEYGLVAGIWTGNGARQVRLAKAMRCGQVFINCFGAGGGIELPFGGVRKSGHGREKGFEALREFSQIKTIVHDHG